MGRAYKPDRIIKSGGVHTFYLGQPEDPITQAFEAYCIHTEQTFSETCRDMIVIALTNLGLLKDPGLANGVFLKAGEGELTDYYFQFRKEAEKIRAQQLARLAAWQRECKKKTTEQPIGADDELGF
jgi:hypothetical protein